MTWMVSARETRWPGSGDWLVITELARKAGAAMVAGIAGSGGAPVVLVSSGTTLGAGAGVAMCRPAEARRELAVATVSPMSDGMT